MKKLVCCLTILLTFVIVFSANMVKAYCAEKEAEYQEKQMLQAEKYNKFSTMWEKHRNENTFQNSFAGVYFDDVKLIINIVEEQKDIFILEYDFDDRFEINYVKYSLVELEFVEKAILESSEILLLREISVNEKTNTVDVITELPELEFYNSFDVKVDHQMINIVSETPELDYMIEYTTNGHEYEIGSGMCTVGFAAEDSSGNPGFVTAGHCVENTGSSVGTNVYYDGDHAGDVDSWHFEDGDVDGAFIELRDPWIGTTWLPTKNLVFGYSYNSIGGLSTNYVIGAYVTFFGKFDEDGELTNTSPELGEITGSGITITYGGTTLYTNMFKTDVDVHHGDSGGPMTTLVYIGCGLYVRDVLGVLSFESNNESYFSKATDIMDELNLSSY